ncbi:hypothetical protein J6590_091456 [Homalodisca vitripennis]|nr:hypothetical protein J6590_091456 [Homalodisca vitripennis]
MGCSQLYCLPSPYDCWLLIRLVTMECEPTIRLHHQRKRPRQSENWKCAQMKKQRYGPAGPPTTITCKHEKKGKTYRCSEITANDRKIFYEKFYDTSVVLPLLHLLGLRPANNCGSCPTRDCRLVPAIFLGYCCGCALPIDRVPILCPTNLICPPLSSRLCGDYNYLMECCC